MVDFINPIDLLIALFIIVIGSLGIKNGFIVELKKIINLSLALFLSHIIMGYIVKLYVPSDTINLLLYILIFIVLILLIGFFIDLALQYPPLFTINKSINKLMGLLLAILKSLVLIATLLFFIHLFPIQKDIKNNFFLKANEGSTLFKVCDNLQSFIIN